MKSHKREYMDQQLRSYLDHIRRMALQFVQTLEQSLAALPPPGGSARA
jgi:hypothetical protein